MNKASLEALAAKIEVGTGGNAGSHEIQTVTGERGDKYSTGSSLIDFPPMTYSQNHDLFPHEIEYHPIIADA